MAKQEDYDTALLEYADDGIMDLLLLSIQHQF